MSITVRDPDRIVSILNSETIPEVISSISSTKIDKLALMIVCKVAVTSPVAVT